MSLDRNGLRILDDAECRRRLTRMVVGRVGLCDNGTPMVLPVNFLVEGGRILIRCSRGSKLEAALRQATVSFEVDDFDAFDHSGWSVLVTGTATVVDDRDERARLETAPLAHWSGAGHDLIAVSIDEISGRELSSEFRVG